MKQRRIGFLTRFFLAIGDFRIYPFSQKEQLIVAISYIFKLTFLSSAIIGTALLININNQSSEMEKEFKRLASDFTVENGMLTSSNPSSGELIEDIYFLVDGQKESGDVKTIIHEFPKTSRGIAMLLNDRLYFAYIFPDGYTQVLKFNYDDYDIETKDGLVSMWHEFNESYSIRLILLITTVLTTFIGLIILRGWTLMIYLITVYMINALFGNKLKFSGYLKVAIYASTVPVVLDTISLVAIGEVPQLASFIEGLICFIYVFYGLRAIRIDQLLMAGIGKTPEERIKDAINKAQKEIEEQLKKDEDNNSNKNEEETKEKEENDKESK